MKSGIVTITLKHQGGRVCADVYRIERLNGAAKVSAQVGSDSKYSGKFWRVGDTITPEVADLLCFRRDYDVTLLAPDTK